MLIEAGGETRSGAEQEKGRAEHGRKGRAGKGYEMKEETVQWREEKVVFRESKRVRDRGQRDTQPHSINMAVQHDGNRKCGGVCAVRLINFFGRVSTANKHSEIILFSVCLCLPVFHVLTNDRSAS